jgi:prepilin-type processing-associated H-X9-DG protein
MSSGDLSHLIMSEQTDLFFASLSHRWQVVILAATAAFGALAWAFGALSKRFRARSLKSIPRWLKFGRIASLTAFVTSLPVLGLSILHIGCAGLVAHETSCQSNLKSLSVALLMYSSDNDERLPNATRWCEAANSMQYFGRVRSADSNSDYFRCPAADVQWGYGMNAALSGKSEKDVVSPVSTVMLFDAKKSARSFSGSQSDVDWSRHNDAPNISMMDGHIMRANKYVRAKLIWSPIESPPLKRATP